MLAGEGSAAGRGVGRQSEPACRPLHRHLAQCRVELAARGAQLIQGFLDIAPGSQAVMHGFQRGADQGGMSLLFTEQLQSRRTLCNLAGQFQSRHQHDGHEAQAENDDHGDQAGRCLQRTEDTG